MQTVTQSVAPSVFQNALDVDAGQREVDRRLAIAPRLAGCIHDPRAADRVVHGLDEIIRSRMEYLATLLVKRETAQ